MVSFKTKLLDDHRKAQGISVLEVANKAGIHPLTYGRVIRGETENPLTIRKIADVLGVPMNEIAEIMPDDGELRAS